MHRITNTLICGALAVGLAAMAGCAPQQNPFDSHTGSAATSSGFQNNGGNGSGTYIPPSPSGTVAGGTVDTSRSEALSDYLKSHHLPLVSAQVVTASNGSPQVILFGYVASEYGKSDAEQKAKTYLNNQNVLVDNRIQISPELAGSGANGNGSGSGGNTNDPYASAGSAQDYQNQQFDPYAAQQQYQYQQQQGGSVMSPGLGLLLGLMGGGGSFGGGGVGFGGGGIGIGGGGFGVGGGSSFGGYGNPYYPPPSAGFYP
jgi:hypothetical protein